MFFNRFNLNPFYAPEGDIGGSVATEEVADLGTDDGAETDPFDSLSFAKGDEEDAVDETEEAAEDEEPVEATEEVENAPEAAPEDKRTSKQDPAIDAVHARARRAEENAARLEKELNSHREAARQETEKQAQAQVQAKLNEQWATHIETARQMREAQYDERVVEQYLEAQKASLQAQEKSIKLEQRLNQIEANHQHQVKEQERQAKERNINEGRGILEREHKDLKAKYGDLVPDANGFDEIFRSLDAKTVDLLQKGLSMEDAFRLVNHEKIAKQEKSLVEKRTTANIVDRSRKTVETNKTEKKAEDKLTPGQIRFAKEFGVDPKEVAKRSNPALFKKQKGVS